MSYSRFDNSSDVYVFMSIHGHLECCGCSVVGGTFYAYSTEQMCNHLDEHRNLGDSVPDEIEDLLWEDDMDNFPNSPFDAE